MLHFRFTNAKQVLLCKYNWWKLDNMKNKPINIHIVIQTHTCKNVANFKSMTKVW